MPKRPRTDSFSTETETKIKRPESVNEFDLTPITAPTRDIHSTSMGDRFIPNRSCDSYYELAELNHTTQPLNQTPYANALHKAMFGMSSQEYSARKVLSFYSVSKKPQENNLNLFHSSQPINLKAVYREKASIQSSRILDAPGIPLDFYTNLLTWSIADRVFLPVKSATDGKFIIASAIAADVNDRKIVQFEPVAQNPRALAALEDDKVLSGWGDGHLRMYRLDTLTAPYQHLAACSSTRINAITVTSPQTCVIANHGGEVSFIDFRVPHAITLTVKIRSDLINPSHIAGLAYNGSNYLATGDNDSQVKLWDIRHMARGALYTNTTHTAAIKGLAFHPDASNYLVSGGGSACRKLCLWNTKTGHIESSIDTGSQITGVHWFKNDPRYLVTSHGHSGAGVKLWHMPHKEFSLECDLKFSNAQSDRALYLAGSPKTNDFAVVNVKETLRFFKPIGLRGSPRKTPALSPNLPPMLSGGLTIR